MAPGGTVHLLSNNVPILTKNYLAVVIEPLLLTPQKLPPFILRLQLRRRNYQELNNESRLRFSQFWSSQFKKKIRKKKALR